MFKHASWLKYVVVGLVFIGAGLILTQPLASEHAPGGTLIRIAITVVAFGIIPVVHRIWPSRGGEKVPARRFVTFFALLVVLLLAVGFFQSWFPSSLRHNLRLERALARLVEAAGGWLLPLLVLVIITTVWLVRRRRLP